MKVFAPAKVYFVNKNLLLESNDPPRDKWNMSCMFAPRGICNPEETLNNKLWSVSGLNLKILFEREI